MDPILIDIDPARVQRYFLIRTPLDRFRMNINRILLPRPLCRGRWDRTTYPVETHPVYRLMEGFYWSGGDFEECRRLLASFYRERGRPPTQAEAKADAKTEDLMDRYIGMLDDMAVNGYRRGQRKDEVGIAIARDGTLLKTSGGWHRFAAAYLLGVPLITAEVRFIHPGWVRSITRGAGITGRNRLRSLVDRLATTPGQ